MIESPRVALALQGGGAHGAFAWGVLDRLLEQGLHPQTISGVSSGAVLGTLLAQGWVRGGADGARREMRLMWEQVATAQLGLAWILPPAREIMWWSLDMALRVFGPAHANPLGNAALRTLLEGLLDRGRLAHASAPRLTVSATDVESGEAVLFNNQTITVDVLLASCCLPFLYEAVTIDGRAYWDGGCAGNPPLSPLLTPEIPERLVLVRAQPRRRSGVPTSSAEIANRLHEIACHAVLSAELAALPPQVAVTSFDADPVLVDLPVASKLNGDGGFLKRLFEAGRNAASAPAVLV